MPADDDDDECTVCYQKMILPTTVPGCGHRFCFLCIKGAAAIGNESNCPKCRGEVSDAIFKRPKARGVTLDMHDPESPSVQLAAAKPSTSWVHPKRVKKSDSGSGPSKKKNKAKGTDSDDEDEKEESPKSELDEAEKEPDEEPMPDEKERVFWLYKGHKGWWRFDPRIEKDIEAGMEATPDSTDVIICGRVYVLDFIQMIQYPRDSPGKIRDIKRVNNAEFKAMEEKGELKGISGVRVV
ncbi:unnamed protein product [Cylicocyclus nassatus]|uniref:E3 ubiquitin-protein ligase n=1 Tax=Cylicocyclus nassatus TaxID=53992 RepID=A0AA36GJX6_CYLNA|nr:unnamed protein product [Cylicocyclus nassatus]